MGYAGGLLGLVISESLLRAFMRHGIAVGWFNTPRVLIVGRAERLRSYLDGTTKLWHVGQHSVSVCELPATTEFERSAEDRTAIDLALSKAVAQAREANAAEVFLLAPSNDDELISRFIETFSIVPASLYLGSSLSNRRPRVGDHGGPGLLPGVLIERQSLTFADRAIKRVFDLAIASIALLVVSPILILAAIVIKLDSPGPVFFRQARNGFNCKPFGIYKFRSMYVAGQGRFEQTKRNDSRGDAIGLLVASPQHRRVAAVDQHPAW